MSFLLRLLLALLLSSSPAVASEPALPPPAIAMKGLATWYPACADCAAASGELQDLLGPGWKGTWVTVSHDGKAVTVKLVTGCACGKRHGERTVIDLSTNAFSRLAPLGTGVIPVVVESVALPPTDTAPLPVWWGVAV